VDCPHSPLPAGQLRWHHGGSATAWRVQNPRIRDRRPR